MIEILKTAYLKKDIKELEQVHIIHDEIMKIQVKDKLFIHIILIAKLVYLTNSPLIGYIEVQSFKSSKIMFSIFFK